jgi:hypothetical protein
LIGTDGEADSAIDTLQSLCEDMQLRVNASKKKLHLCLAVIIAWEGDFN